MYNSIFSKVYTTSWIKKVLLSKTKVKEGSTLKNLTENVNDE